MERNENNDIQEESEQKTMTFEKFIDNQAEELDYINSLKKKISKMKKSLPQLIGRDDNFNFFISCVIDPVKFSQLFNKFRAVVKFVDMFDIEDEFIRNGKDLCESDGIQIDHFFGDLHNEFKKNDQLREVFNEIVVNSEEVLVKQDNMKMLIESISEKMEMKKPDIKKAIEIKYKVDYKDKFKEEEIHKVKTDIKSKELLIEYSE